MSGWGSDDRLLLVKQTEGKGKEGEEKMLFPLLAPSPTHSPLTESRSLSVSHEAAGSSSDCFPPVLSWWSSTHCTDCRPTAAALLVAAAHRAASKSFGRTEAELTTRPFASLRPHFFVCTTSCTASLFSGQCQCPMATKMPFFRPGRLL